jgi:hypothetical protein
VYLKARFSFFLIILAFVSASAQTSYPKNYFGSPLTIPLTLAGNFGEIRLNHFHYGLDFRTNNREGYPVLAAADGYISRIKVSGYGYGKVIYINHPNGYTTVYGHLSEFNPPISEHVKAAQYKNEKFEFEYYPNPYEFPVKKGQIIALSGNTGGSQGPHLHFEIRDTKTEEPINPLLFGLNVKDEFPPVVDGYSIYTFGKTTEQDIRKDYPLKRTVKTKVATLRRLANDTILVPPVAGIGFSAYDRENESGSMNGIFRTVMLVDRDTVFHCDIDRFSFEQARYVNAHIDYKQKVDRQPGKLVCPFLTIQKSFLSPNQKSPVYKKVKDQGVISLKDTMVHEVRFIFSDLAGNKTETSFHIKRSDTLEKVDTTIKGELFRYDKVNIYKRDNILIDIPSYSLYNDVDFVVKERQKMRYGYSKIYTIADDNIPLQSAFILKIKPDNCDSTIKQKLLIVSIADDGKLRNAGGDWVGNELTTELKSFGTYTVYLDTVPPFARHEGFKRGQKVTTKAIRVKAYDNLGDVTTYKGYIDGEWKLFEFDAKSDVFTYKFEEPPSNTKHELRFQCSDAVGNKTVITVPFIR